MSDTFDFAEMGESIRKSQRLVRSALKHIEPLGKIKDISELKNRPDSELYLIAMEKGFLPNMHQAAKIAENSVKAIESVIGNIRGK